MRVADRLFIGSTEAEMVECDPQRLETYRRKLTQIHLVPAQNARVNALIKIDTTLASDALAIPPELGARHEPKIADLGDNFLEERRSNDIVLHQHQVFLGAVKFLDTTHYVGK